jgi:periplasmic protein TonB
MQHETIGRLCKLFFFSGIIVSMAACHGDDATAKESKDSTVVAATKTVKKQGKTSVTFTASNGKVFKEVHGVYNQAEVSPAFPGGQDALSNYINNNITYSQTAIDNNVSGTIHVSFVVDEKGKVENPQVIDNKNPNDGLNEETIKMFNNMPLWEPGMVKGKKVKTRMELPISFQLEDAQ